MNLVEVDGKLTIERIGEYLTLGYTDLLKLSRLKCREDEKEYYNKIEEDLNRVAGNYLNTTSRRLFTVVNPNPEISDGCITLIHLLPRGRETSMVVYMRSSSQHFISSDLAFLARLALSYKCVVLDISFGSFHVELNAQL